MTRETRLDPGTSEFHAESAARVLLVRAVEEVAPERIPPEMLLEAHLAAGDPREEETWICRRARYLTEHALPRFAPFLDSLEVAPRGRWLMVGLVLIVGLASNWLGPSTRVHVIWNPIVVLIAWNVIVYAGVICVSLWKRGKGAPESHPRDLPDQERSTGHSSFRPGFLQRVFLGRVMPWFLRLGQIADEAGKQAKEMREVWRRFVALWLPFVRPKLGRWMRQTLHLCAIALAVGAIGGMYLRGLFVEYSIYWESTFLNDPRTVAGVLLFVLGPAAFLLQAPMPDSETVIRMMEGLIAGPWIHLYAVSAVLYIVLPRASAIVIPRAIATLRRGSTHRDVARPWSIDFDSEYYRNLLTRALSVAPRKLEDHAREAVREECRTLADRLSSFVCRHLYDERLAPRIREFRETGGSLTELEAELERECEDFRPVLDREMEGAAGEFEDRLVSRVSRLLGDAEDTSARPPDTLTGEVSESSSRTATYMGERVSGDLTTIVANVVSTSVAVVVGTVSGGFGEALGIALLVGIVETGPVGWIVGAVAGFVATSALFSVGKRGVKEKIKEISLPAWGLKTVLWKGRYEGLIEEGRQRCEEAIHEALLEELDPLAVRIGDHIWDGLRPVLGEMQRPYGEDEARAAPTASEGVT